jgi:hypothetical protein
LLLIVDFSGDIILQGAKRLSLPLKIDCSRPHTLCQIRFSPVTVKREDEIEVVVQAAEERYANRVNGEKRTNPVMAVFACPGGGKSRFLDLDSEYLTSLRSDSPSCLEDSLVLAMSYNGVTGTPSGVDADLGLSASFGLAARIVWSHFIEQGQPTDQFFKFGRFLQENVPDMRVEHCLRLV